MSEILIILGRTFIGYFIVNILMRIMGKREIGQLSLFDLLILLTIVDIMVIGLENYDKKYLYWIIPMIVLAGMQVVFSYVSLKCVWFRKLIDGEPSIIINKGKMEIKSLKKNKYNIDDLYTQLRSYGVGSIEEVEYAILEISGKLSVYKYGDTNYFPIPIIVSGKVSKIGLNGINKDMTWVYEELKKNNIKNIKDVYCASYKNNHLVFRIK